MSDSAGETPAAPPDPWFGVYAWIDDRMPVWSSWAKALKQQISITLATERQHHAAQLAEKDYVIKLAEQHWTEYKATEESLNANLTAARAEIAGKRDECELLRTQVASQHKIADERLAANFKQGAEIARLTEERDDHSQCHDTACNGSRQKPRGAKGVSCSCRGRDIAYQRAEAAEASLLALQQQMGTVLLRMTVAGTWGAVEKLISEARAALASHLTGGPA